MTEHEENMRLLKLIREEPAWALARVKRAAELEQQVRGWPDEQEGLTAPDAAGQRFCRCCGAKREQTSVRHD